MRKLVRKESTRRNTSNRNNAWSKKDSLLLKKLEEEDNLSWKIISESDEQRWLVIFIITRI